MTIIRVAIPLLKGKRRFHLEKGRPWSVVEHAVLAAITTRPRSVSELSSESSLPRRLVLEILIRLMRAGWVEFVQHRDGIIFSASNMGKAVVVNDELPSTPRRMTRWMNFVIDKVTGTLYRSREFPFHEKHILEERSKNELLVWMQSRSRETYDEPTQLVSTLFEDDEKFIAVDPAGDRLVDRYGLVTVRDGDVDGLPYNAPAELKELSLQAAASAPETPAGKESPSYKPSPPTTDSGKDLPTNVNSTFRLDDLILGGQQHRDVFYHLLRIARSRIIIHSTFIAEEKYAVVRELLYDAAKRGVIIDILWGEDEEKSSSQSSSSTALRMKKEINKAGLAHSLRVHCFSTGSHAKLLISDIGNPTDMIAIVGSCNWLSSAFESFEASVRLRDPCVVGTLLLHLSELTRGSDGHWTELTNDLVRLAGNLPKDILPDKANAEIAIVLGPQHSHYVRQARDKVTQRLFVTSHRLGAATRPAIVVPAVAAVQERGVKADIFYSIPSGQIGGFETANITHNAAEQGVTIRPVKIPRLHAKILAWDNDNLLVTSQNWLSADPSEAKIRREIGVFINTKNVGHRVIETFNLLRQDP